MKRIVAALFIAALAFGFAGCAANIPPPHTLRLGEPDEPDNLNPLFGEAAASDLADGMLYSYLLRYDARGNYIPDLATQVPTLRNGGISSDGKVITIHLRRGVRWADGAPLDARDWIFTYHAVFNPRNNVKTRYGWDDIASASAPNRHTIVIRLKHPMAAFLGVLAIGGSGYPPLPAHVLAKLASLNRASFNDAPLSSGPYILQDWHHGASLTFAANPRYFRGKPKLAHVRWVVIPNANSMLNALRTHEIDVDPSVGETQIPELASIHGIHVVHTLLANWRHLGFNCSRPILRDVRVRLAIAEGIAWKRLRDTIYHGVDLPAVSDIFPESWAAPKIAPYPYDPAHAAALLRAAGWRRSADGVRTRAGQRLVLTIISGSNRQSNERAEVVMQAMLRKLGIDLRIRNYPPSFLFAQNGPIYSGHYDMEWSIDTNGPDPDNSGSWNSAFIPPNGANTNWLRDPIVDATSSAAASTFDQTLRKRLYQREEERIHELVPMVFVYWERSTTAIDDRVRDYIPASFIGDSWNAWQWEVVPSASHS